MKGEAVTYHYNMDFRDYQKENTRKFGGKSIADFTDELRTKGLAGDIAGTIIDTAGELMTDPMFLFGMYKSMTQGFERAVKAPTGNYADDLLESTKNCRSQNLMDELARSGEKYTPKDVIAIAKTPDGTLVWLETGNSSAGFAHVMKYAGEFVTRGIPVDQIPEFLIKTITEGKIVGMQGTKPIYEIIFNGKVQRTAIGIGSNGFIVAANSAPLP